MVVHPHWLRRIVAFALTTFALFSASPAHGDLPGPRLDVIQLPEPGAKSAGFQIAIQFQDLRLFGDIPVRVLVNPTTQAFAADRELLIRIAPDRLSTQPPGNEATYEIPVKLPEGASSVDVTHYLPKWTLGGNYEVVVEENRESLQGYRARVEHGTLFPSQSLALWQESAGQRYGWILKNNQELPDARVFCAQIAPELMNLESFETVAPGFAFASAWRQFRAVTVDSLPHDWRGFAGVDVWVVEADTVRDLFSANAKAVQALQDYVRCGGTLWILGSDSRTAFASLFPGTQTDPAWRKESLETAVDQANQPFDFEPARASQYQPATMVRAYLRELALNRGSSNFPVTGALGRPRMASPSLTPAIDALFDENLAWLRAWESSHQEQNVAPEQLSRYAVSAGAVVLNLSEHAVPGTPQQWRALQHLTIGDASQTLVRAVDPVVGDIRFWEWIIPDVAQPPIYTFIGLLLTFVVVVGPLSYRKFTQLGRGYLMFFVAPLLALVTTLTMFAYGLVADGLSTRVRVREVTWIGDHSGDVARITRATYFAGIRPAAGMTFPANATVLPYQLPTVETWNEATQREATSQGTVRLSSEAIQLDSAFLPSRQQKQFVSYRPVADFGNLEWSEDAGQVMLRNSTALELRTGVLRAGNGKYYSFESVPRGKSIPIAEISERLASEQLSLLYGLQRPLPPPAIASSRRQGQTTIDMLTLYGSGPQRVTTLPRLMTGESLVEAWLRDSLQISSELAPQTFVAVANVTEDCIAVPGASVVESIHYVIGVLK